MAYSIIAQTVIELEKALNAAGDHVFRVPFQVELANVLQDNEVFTVIIAAELPGYKVQQAIEVAKKLMGSNPKLDERIRDMTTCEIAVTEGGCSINIFL